MTDITELTEGAVRSIVENEVGSFAAHQGPIVQILRITNMPVNMRGNRYRLVLSDGQNFFQSMLGVNLNHLVTSGQMVDNALIRIQDYGHTTIQDMRVFILFDLEVINGQYGRKIGNPSDVAAAPSAGATSQVRSPTPPAASETRPSDQASPVPAARCSTGSSPLQQLGDAIAEEMKCPISQELLVDAVTAEDGFHYEREDIVNYIKHVRDNNLTLRSPKTNLPMGERLNDAIAVRNTIQRLMESGAISGKRAEMYRQRSLVIETKKKAAKEDVEAMELLAAFYKDGLNGLEKSPKQAKHWGNKARLGALRNRVSDGDTEAMCILGRAHTKGQLGLKQDHRKAFDYYDMAAKKMNVHGMAHAGYSLCHGLGTENDKFLGVTLVAASAAMNSAFGCVFLGLFYYEGIFGLQKDLSQSKYWLERAFEMNGQSDSIAATLDDWTMCCAHQKLHVCRINMSELDSKK